MGNTESGREPVILVEIDQAICVNTFGVAPCTAALSAGTPHKCFNTMKTCADPDNFDLAVLPLTLRFCKTAQVVPRQWGAIPCLESVSTTPMQLNPGGASKNSGALGARATVTIKLRDLPYADFKVDPYQSERYSGAAQNDGIGYNPIDRGSFWTKWIRRNPYYVNWPIRIREGYIEDDPASMVTRNYIIEDISEPGADGRVTIKAQDVMALAENEKAQCPAPTLGTLDRDISATGFLVDCCTPANSWTNDPFSTAYYFDNSTGVLFEKPDAVYFGGALGVEAVYGALTGNQWCWGDHNALGYDTLYVRLNADVNPNTKAAGYIQSEYLDVLTLVDWVAGEYPAGGGTVRFGDELATYTAATEGATICVLTGVVRGTDGSTAAAHSSGDLVQLCYRVADADNVYCWEVAYDLLINYANMPAAYIPYADWVTEGTTWLDIFTVHTVISEPTGVNQLLGELCEQCLFNIWWDEREQEIKFRALRSPSENPVELNDRQHIMPGWTTKVDMKQRVSEVWVYYAPKDYTKKIDDSTNYSAAHIIVDPPLESDEKYSEPRIKTIFSRWLENSTQCIHLTSRYLNRFQDGAKYLKIKVDAKDRGNIWTGTVVATTMESMVNAVGIPEARRWQVISAEEIVPGEIVEYNMLNYLYAAARYGYYDLAVAPHDGVWADADGLLADGSEGYSYE